MLTRHPTSEPGRDRVHPTPRTQTSPRVGLGKWSRQARPTGSGLDQWSHWQRSRARGAGWAAPGQGRSGVGELGGECLSESRSPVIRRVNLGGTGCTPPRGRRPARGLVWASGLDKLDQPEVDLTNGATGTGVVGAAHPADAAQRERRPGQVASTSSTNRNGGRTKRDGARPAGRRASSGGVADGRVAEVVRRAGEVEFREPLLHVLGGVALRDERQEGNGAGQGDQDQP